jgi:hypothetical protein
VLLLALRQLPSSGILSYLNSSGSKLVLLFRGEEILRLPLLLSLEVAYTDASFFETICQILGDDLDSAGTHELVQHIRGEATPDERFLHPLQAQSAPYLGSLARLEVETARR